MEPLQQQFEMCYRYVVYPTTGVFNLENALLRDVIATGQGPERAHKVLVVVDAGLAKAQPRLLGSIEAYAHAYASVIDLVSAPLILPGGEAAKNDSKLVERLHSVVDQFGICRHSYLVAVGGGAFIDMVGYAAATAHRGIRLIRVPTTVLAQNDAAIGVKNGINAFGKKNFIGTFAPPFAVINDVAFLSTLSDRDWRSGTAEAVKVALLKDATFFGWIEANVSTIAHRDTPAMAELIHRCARLHLAHIATSGDPFEQGSSRPLDFGHWAAHKLEKLTDHALRHGEAVAIGLALDSTYAALSGMLAEGDLARIFAVLRGLGFSLYVPELEQHWERPEAHEDLLSGLKEFQEHLGGQLTVTLLKGIGRPVDVHALDGDRIRASITHLKTLHLQAKGEAS